MRLFFALSAHVAKYYITNTSGETPMKYTIFTLADPRDQLVRVVTSTTQRSRKRFSDMIAAVKLGADNSPKGQWIKSLLDEGLLPVVTTRLEAGSRDESHEVCVNLTKQLRDEGHPVITQITSALGRTGRPTDKNNEFPDFGPRALAWYKDQKPQLPMHWRPESLLKRYVWFLLTKKNAKIKVEGAEWTLDELSDYLIEDLSHTGA